MSEIRIARTYAKSILDLAKELNVVAEIRSDLTALESAFENRDLHLLLKSPIIKSAKKLNVFEKLFKGKLSDLTMRFLTKVITKGREGVLPEIVNQFNVQYNTLKKIKKVTVISATELNDQLNAQIKSAIIQIDPEMVSIEMDLKIDPSLIGGFIIDFGDKRYNASVKHNLQEIKKAFN